MKRILTVLLIAILVITGIWFLFFRNKKNVDTGPVQQPLTVSKHSDVFNRSAINMIDAYYNLTEAFVVWDTVAISKYSAELKVRMDSLRLTELQKDTVIYETAKGILENAKAEVEGLINDPTLEEKRLAFNSLTQYIYDLFRTVRYDQGKIYFQECPSAFGEDKPGNWLSKTAAVRNPYPGKEHPKFKEQLLDCGGPKDTLNFMAAGATNH
jgi:hypothetical protein